MIRRSVQIVLFGLVFLMARELSGQSQSENERQIERQVYINTARLSSIEQQVNTLTANGTDLSRSDHTQIELLRVQVDQIRSGILWVIAFLATNIGATVLMMLRNYLSKHPA